MKGLDRRERLALAAFAALRVGATIGLPVARFPDTAAYETAPSFVGSAARPWTLPLLYALVPVDSLRVLAQLVIAIACWGWLAVALSRRFEDPTVRTVALCGVLLLGTTARATGWDTAMLTESIAMSLTVALLAAALMIDRRWMPPLFVAVFTLWTFTRDSHVYLAALVVATAAVGWRAEPRLRRAVAAMAIVVAWAWAAGANNTWTEGFNVAANIAARHDEPQWFLDRGMPDSPVFGLPPAERQDAAWDDPELREWARTEGPGAYARYLVTHPRFTATGISALVVDDELNGGTMFDGDGNLSESRAPLPDPLERVLWPMYGVPLLLPAAVLAALVAVRHNRRRLIEPTLLLASTLPHALLVYHGSPIELGRHALVLTLVVAVGSWWLLVEGWSTLRSSRTPSTGSRAPQGDAAGDPRRGGASAGRAGRI